MKPRIAILPNFPFEAGISAFFDLKKYKIIPIDITDKNLTEKYGQKLFGEWCYPLKLINAAIEQVIVEKKVSKVILLDLKMCRYPFITGNIDKITDQKVEVYPISIKGRVSATFILDLFRQFKQFSPELSFPIFIKDLALAYRKVLQAEKLQDLYYKHLPLVKNPLVLKQKFEKYKQKIINNNNIDKVIKKVNKFAKFAKKQKIREKPEHKVLLSGDFSIFFTEFPIMDLDIFLAKQKIQIVQPYKASKAGLIHRNEKSKEIIDQVFSTNNLKIKSDKAHFIEQITISQIFSGLEKKIDGIIFAKPNMCTPCENVSFILKKMHNFNLPLVEISYDEHSGENGIITRLEAFINILRERKLRSGEDSNLRPTA